MDSKQSGRFKVWYTYCSLKLFVNTDYQVAEGVQYVLVHLLQDIHEGLPKIHAVKFLLTDLKETL